MEDKLYLIDYYECEKINNAIYDKHNIYDGSLGGNGIEIFDNIYDLKKQLLTISKEIARKKINNEAMSISINEYNIENSLFKDIVEKIQDYYNWDGYNEATEEYEDKIEIVDYIDNLKELNFEKSYFIYTENEFSDLITDIFEFDIVNEALETYNKLKKQGIEDLDELFDEILYEVKKEFPFFNKQEEIFEKFMKENVLKNKSLADKIKEKKETINKARENKGNEINHKETKLTI